jgi:long-chain fatty acid transport protein
MTVTPRSVLTAFGLFCLSASLQAQPVQNIVLRNSFSPVGAGARGLGMGGAFIAVADDGTAASFNPAGLSQLRRSEISLVGFTSSLRSTITNAGRGGLADTSQTDRHQAPDFAGLAVPFEVGGRNLTVQVSYQRSIDLFGRGSAQVFQSIPTTSLVSQGLLDEATVQRLRIPAIADVVLEVAPTQKGAFHNVSFAAGYQVTDRLSLGLSTNYWIADWTATGTSTTRIVSTAGNRTGPPTDLVRVQSRFEQKQSMRGFNTNLGLLLKFARLSIGGVARLPFAGDYDLEETGNVTIGEAGKPGIASTEIEETARSAMLWPRSLGVGLALRPFSRLTLAADLSKAYWSRAVIESVPNGALLTSVAPGGASEQFVDRNLFDLEPQSTTSTRDTVQWRAGAEFLITTSKVVFPLRVGAFRDRSPIAELSSGEGRSIEGLTAGIGINFASVVLDLGFERKTSSGAIGLRLGRSTSGAGATSTDLSAESVREDRFVASLLYRFKGGSSDPLKRFFKFLFVGREHDDDGSTP